MISLILSAGVLSILVTALVKGISDTMRGVVCWSFSSISALASLIVYFSAADSYSPDMDSVLSGVFGLAVVMVCVLLIELFSPAKRFRRGGRREYDRDKAEDSLNVVMIIISSSAVISVVCCVYFGGAQFSLFGIVPLAAVSIRQLSYFMYRVKNDTLNIDSDAIKRVRLIKGLDPGKRSL